MLKSLLNTIIFYSKPPYIIENENINNIILESSNENDIETEKVKKKLKKLYNQVIIDVRYHNYDLL